MIPETGHQSSRSVTRQERFAVGSQLVKPEDKQKETEGHKRNTFECIALQGDDDTYYAASKPVSGNGKQETDVRERAVLHWPH